MNITTKQLHALLTMLSDKPFPEVMPIVQLYHLARCADALERLADHIENGQIATLDGRDIVNELTDIRKAMENGK